ncbi:MAG: hypothetical protein ACI94Y_001778 [Maribacter sp.]|jgi:hypothetical protein
MKLFQINIITSSFGTPAKAGADSADFGVFRSGNDWLLLPFFLGVRNLEKV